MNVTHALVGLWNMLRFQIVGNVRKLESSLCGAFNQRGFDMIAEVLRLVGNLRVHQVFIRMYVSLLGQRNTLVLQPFLKNGESVHLVLHLTLTLLEFSFIRDG